MRKMHCSVPDCSAFTVRDVSCGAAGYGRDVDVAFVGGDAAVSFLDLGGEDSLARMRARLVLFDTSPNASSAGQPPWPGPPGRRR